MNAVSECSQKKCRRRGVRLVGPCMSRIIHLFGNTVAHIAESADGTMENCRSDPCDSHVDCSLVELITVEGNG